MPSVKHGHDLFVLNDYISVSFSPDTCTINLYIATVIQPIITCFKVRVMYCRYVVIN